MRRMAIFGFIGLLLAGVGVLAANAAVALDLEKLRNRPPQPIVSRSYDSWSFSAARLASGRVRVTVDYDATSRAGIEAFAGAMRAEGARLLREGEQEFDVLVTFRRPLSTEEFQALVTSGDMAVRGYTIRTFQSDGLRGTTGQAAGGDKTVTVTGREFADSVAGLMAQLGDPAFQPRGDKRVTGWGFISVEGTVNAAGYLAFVAAAETYVVNVGATIALREVRNIEGRRPREYEVRGMSPYWWMENYGIAAVPPGIVLSPSR